MCLDIKIYHSTGTNSWTKNLKKGYIQPSQSPQASPFFFVKKKDERLWPCQDYRYLNDWTVKNIYPLPSISEIMDKLKEAKYFSKFDVWWGYNNIWIWSGDKWKAAFKTNWGLYEPTVMFFRMCNSLVTSKAMMDEIFKKEIKEDLIIVYMDDILTFSKMIDGLKKIEQIILKKAENRNHISKPRNANSENRKSNTLDWLLKKENWQWIPLNSKEYWTGLHQKQLKKYNSL
jgi:Reverse transcriptase (RNA-dependent DNA polymerase)